MEQKEIPHMPADSIQPDAQQKQEYEQYVKSVTPTHNLWTQMGKAFLTGGIICCIGQGILNYTGNVLGMDHFRKLVFPASGIFVCSTHGVSYLPQDCKMGRRRCIGANHRIRQFRDGSGGGIPKGRSGIRHRLQDIYHCGAGDPVWNLCQLGVGADPLGVADVWNPCGVV